MVYVYWTFAMVLLLHTVQEVLSLFIITVRPHREMAESVEQGMISFISQIGSRRWMSIAPLALVGMYIVRLIAMYLAVREVIEPVPEEPFSFAAVISVGISAIQAAIDLAYYQKAVELEFEATSKPRKYPT